MTLLLLHESVVDDSTFVSLATLSELAVRLGRIDESELTAAQQAQGEQLLATATDLLIDAVDRDADWLTGLDSASNAFRVLRGICLEMCARVMTNPTGARSEAETVGSYSHSVSFTDGSHLLMLTDREERMARRATVGVTSGSAQLESLATVVAESMPRALDELVTAGEDDAPIYTWT